MCDYRVDLESVIQVSYTGCKNAKRRGRYVADHCKISEATCSRERKYNGGIQRTPTWHAIKFIRWMLDCKWHEVEKKWMLGIRAVTPFCSSNWGCFLRKLLDLERFSSSGLYLISEIDSMKVQTSRWIRDQND